MKTRFEMSLPLHERHATARQNVSTPPSSRKLSGRPSLKQIETAEKNHTPSNPNTADETQLENELPAAELELFSQALIAQLNNQQESTHILDELPSYIRLSNEYSEALTLKKEQLTITKALIKATEPVVANPMIEEQDKQSLLEVTGLALEKVMQLKMRVSNIKQRLIYMQKMVPQYALNHAKHLGYSETFCKQLAAQAKALL